MKNAIGIIANPASGKDIRRLVAYGSATDNMEKVNVVRRIILGARSYGVTDVYYMPDYFEIVETAVKGMHSEHRAFIEGMAMHRLDTEALGIENDTVLAAAAMEALGLGCVVTLGGDGTCRAAAKSLKGTAMISISTGTNNVFPRHLEGTVAGMAAGAFVSGFLTRREDYLLRSKRLDIYKNGEYIDMALVDAVVVDEIQIASRAIWSPATMRQIILSRCSAHSIGISSIGGQLLELNDGDGRGLAMEIGEGGVTVEAPIAPGLFASIPIRAHRLFNPGEGIPIRCVPCIIAVDGERTVEFFTGDEGEIHVNPQGPNVIMVEKLLADAVRLNLPRIPMA